MRPRSTGGKAPPMTPMSERQQMALLMQMTTTNTSNQQTGSTGSRSPGGSGQSKTKDRNERGETPLHLAAIKGDIEQVSKLLSHRADPNVTDFAGWTPLHEACNHGWYEVALKLIQAGASVNARGLDDETPLHDAAANGQQKLVKLLVEKGADVNAKNKKGKTPIDVASPRVLSILCAANNTSNTNINKDPSNLSNQRIQNRTNSRDEKKTTEFSKKITNNNAENNNSMETSPSSNSSNTTTGSLSKITLTTTSSSTKILYGSSSISTTSNTTQSSSSTTNTTASGILHDIYEFKSVKESSNSPDLKVANVVTVVADPLEISSNDAVDPLSIPPSQNQLDDPAVSSSKRPFSDITTDPLDDTDDDTKRKKTSASGGSNKMLGPSRTQNVANKGATSKPGYLGANKSSVPSKSPCPSPKPSVSNDDSSASDDSKSSASANDLKVPPLKIVIPQSNNGEQDSNTNVTSGRNGKSSSQRSHHHHHSALPYVVPSGEGNVAGAPLGEKDSSGLPTGEPKNVGENLSDEQKSSHHQRVLRSHRGGEKPERNGSGGPNTNQSDSKPSGGTDSSTRTNNSSPMQSSRNNSPSPMATTSSGATSTSVNSTISSNSNISGQGSNNNEKSSTSTFNDKNQNSNENSQTNLAGTNGRGENSTNSNSTSNNSKSDNQQSSNDHSDISNTATTTSSSQANSSNTSSSNTSQSNNTVELHPRKRKLRPSKEQSSSSSSNAQSTSSTSNQDQLGSNSTSNIHSGDQSSITNCYQLYINIKKQIERRRKSLFPVQPKPPQGFKDYLMNRCTYVLARNAPTQPNVVPPSSVPQQLKELYVEQEKERYKLRMQHVIEKEKLVLSVEQEILRVHGLAARTLANQTLPFSVCTVLRDEEVYNLITPEQEEKDRAINVRSRYNGRLFLSWLQDVDDKWEKIKEAMLKRHHFEAQSLHGVQKMDWEWKLKELDLCDFNTKPQIDETHVPLVHVSDDFDLLPT